MKFEVDGVEYDIDEAEWIGAAHFGRESDFRWYDERLLMTTAGDFFLEGEGGLESRWGGYEGEGPHIYPLSAEEALKWCEEHKRGIPVELEFLIEDA